MLAAITLGFSNNHKHLIGFGLGNATTTTTNLKQYTKSQTVTSWTEIISSEIFYVICYTWLYLKSDRKDKLKRVHDWHVQLMQSNIVCIMGLLLNKLSVCLIRLDMSPYALSSNP